MSTPGSIRVGAALATVAALLIGWGALSTRWYESGGEPSFRVGLLTAEQCRAGECRSASVREIEDPSLARLGLGVAGFGILAALGLLGSAARALSASEGLAWLPRLTLGLSVFSVCVGVGYVVLAPWSESMAPSLSAFAYFAGAAMGGGVTGVLLGGLRSR